MGTFSNLFELLRDDSYSEIENEVAREVTIALAGNTLEARDKLHRALSTRLESLWTPSPFRLLETSERPTIDQAETASTGLLVYSLYQGDRIPAEKRGWLRELALSGQVSVLIVALDRKGEESFNRERKRANPLQVGNLLRLVGGREAGSTISNSAAADGAAFNNAQVELRAAWMSEIEELVQETGAKISLVRLSGLELARLQAELLPAIVQRLSGRELALARRAPIFRNTVAGHLIAQAARSNAEMVLLANLTAGVPLLSGFFASGADFVVLTRNQFGLSHRLAEIYGQKRDSRTEIYLEIAPIIGAAFAWKMISTLVVRRLPGFVAMAPKAGIAYGATLLVGRVAQVYYASGRKAPRQAAAFVRGIYEQISGRKGRSGFNRPSGDTPRQLRSS